MDCLRQRDQIHESNRFNVSKKPPDLLKTQPRGSGRGDGRGSTRRVLDITESNAADHKEDSVLDLTDTNQELLNTKAPLLQIRLK